jgi:hypothetical protein
MIITNEFLDSHRCSGGYTKAQLAVFGIAWPPLKGWKETIVDKEWPDEIAKAYIKARSEFTKGTHKAFLKRIRRAKRRKARRMSRFAG